MELRNAIELDIGPFNGLVPTRSIAKYVLASTASNTSLFIGLPRILFSPFEIAFSIASHTLIFSLGISIPLSFFCISLLEIASAKNSGILCIKKPSVSKPEALTTL